MLAELFDKIGVQAVKANGPHVLTPKAEPEFRYGVLDKDGNIDWREAEPQPRQHKASDLATIARFVSDHSDHAEVDGVELGPVVWYSRSGVVALLKDDQRRDRVAILLNPSPQMVTLSDLAGKEPWHDHPGFVRLLRIKLADTLSLAGNLVDIVRQVKFNVTTDGQSRVGHGKASIGKSIESELVGTGAVPETVTLTVQVFDGHPWRANVSCAIEIDSASQKFQLLPFPGAIEKALRDGEASLAADLGQALADAQAIDVPVYYGVP